MFHYRAFNLRIASDIPLPELRDSDGGGDVEIRTTAVGSPITGRSIQWTESPVPSAHFLFPKAGSFSVKNGREIIVTPEPNIDASLLRLYIQGVMLATILYQRGLFVLHASAVKIDRRAVAFIGPVGAGKSSLAAALHKRGHSVVSDDNAALDSQTSRAYVQPGFPALKVYPDVAASLGFDRPSLRPTHPSQIKRVQEAERGFSFAPLPLESIYVLVRNGPNAPRRLSPIESVTELIRHSVPARWGITGSGVHLRKCAQLARAIPIFRIKTFEELSELPQIAERVENHCSEPEAIAI